MIVSEPAAKPYHHGDLAQASLKVALDLLQEAGLEKFSLREVARRLGVSLTALYHHFPDKETLLANISRQGMEEFRERLESASGDPTLGPRELISQMGLAYVGFFVEKPYYLDLIFLPAHKADAVICGIWQNTFARLEALLAAQGWDQERIPLLGVWLWSSVHGLATMFREGILGRPDDYIEGASPVFEMTGEELLSRVTPLIAGVLGQAVSLPKT